jgi:transcriptional repressor NrdR
MNCPFCEYHTTNVIDTRKYIIDNMPAVRRRRRCVNCHKPFVTFEVSEMDLRGERQSKDNVEAAVFRTR